MEDFNFAQNLEQAQGSQLHAEWLDNAVFANTRPNKIDLVFANIANEKTENKKETSNSSDQQESEKLDRELRAFADGKIENASHNMQRFQKAVGKFCDSNDKQTAMDALGDTYTSLDKMMDVENEALFYAAKKEAENTPGRKELEAAYKAKQNDFFDKMNHQPFEESERIMDMIRRQDGESKDQQRERIRKGLSSNKTMLDAYNAECAAADKIDANKGPREKHLENLRSQIETDAAVMKAQVQKAYLRSTY